MRLFIIIAITASLSFGQVTSGQVDFSGASSTKPFRESASDTATCGIGELYRNTATGLLRICGTTNTWSNFTSFENAVLGRSGIPATAGLVPFANGTAGTLDTDSLFSWDNTNKRLGVGIGSATTQIHAVSSTSSVARMEYADSATSLGSAGAGVRLVNTNSTTNNFVSLAFADANGTSVGGTYMQVANQTSHYGNLILATRASDGYLARLSIVDGNVGVAGVSSPAYSIDVTGGVGKTGTSLFHDRTATTGVTRSRWTGGAAQSTVPLIATAGTESLTVGVGDNTYLTLANGGAATFTSSVTATRHAYSSLTDPANNATCTAGETIASATYFYVCTATNTWKRLELVAY